MKWGEDVKKALGDMKGGSNDYLKLETGQPRLVMVLSEPVTFYKIFGDQVEHQNYVAESTFKFKVNLAVLSEDNSWEVKLWEGSKTSLETLNKAVMKYGTDKILEIERTGKDMKTRYNIVYDRDATASERAFIAKLKPFPLYLRDETKISYKEPGDDIPNF